MQKLVAATREEADQIRSAWWDDRDQYAPPAGFKEISAAEFARRFFLHAYNKVEHRWIKLPDVPIIQQVMFYFEYSDDNVAMANCVGGPRFFEFGCHHELQFARNLGRCYNEYWCPKCGRTFSIDSSD